MSDRTVLPVPAWLACSLLLLAAAVAMWGAWRMQVFFADDAYIAYRFSQHVAQGTGFVWNPGEASGFLVTSPAHALISALPIALGWDPLLTNRMLAVALHVLSTLLVWSSLRAMRVASAIAVVAAAFYLGHPVAVFQVVHGMETSLWLMAHALCLCAVASRLGPWLPATTGLLLCVRPEAPVYVAVYLAFYLLTAPDRVQAARWVLASVAIVIAYYLLTWLLLGSAVPITKAKIAPFSFAQLLSKIFSVGSSETVFLVRFIPPIAIAAVLALLADRPIIDRLPERTSPFWIALVALLLGTGTYFIYHFVYLYMDMYFRFRAPAILYWTVFAGFALAHVLGRERPRGFPLALSRIGALVVALPILALLAFNWREAFQYTDGLGFANRNAHWRVAQVFRAHGAALRDRTLWASSAGVLNYYFSGYAVGTYFGETGIASRAPDVVAVLGSELGGLTDAYGEIGTNYNIALEKYVRAGIYPYGCPPFDMKWMKKPSWLQVYVLAEARGELGNLLDDLKSAEEAAACPKQGGG